jgi:hypothetical protein
MLRTDRLALLRYVCTVCQSEDIRFEKMAMKLRDKTTQERLRVRLGPGSLQIATAEHSSSLLIVRIANCHRA